MDDEKAKRVAAEFAAIVTTDEELREEVAEEFTALIPSGAGLAGAPRPSRVDWKGIKAIQDLIMYSRGRSPHCTPYVQQAIDGMIVAAADRAFRILRSDLPPEDDEL